MELTDQHGCCMEKEQNARRHPGNTCGHKQQPATQALAGDVCNKIVQHQCYQSKPRSTHTEEAPVNGSTETQRFTDSFLLHIYLLQRTPPASSVLVRL